MFRFFRHGRGPGGKSIGYQLATRPTRKRRDAHAVLPKFESLEPRHLLTGLGDFNGDSRLDVQDVDALIVEMIAGTDGTAFDLTNDGQVDNADLDMLIVDVLQTVPGDVNLDGRVDRKDLAVMATHYGATGAPSWGNGNVNGDSRIDLSDVAHLQTHYGLAGPADPGIVAISTELSSGLEATRGELSLISARFNLPAADDLPGIDNQLADLLELDSLLASAVPSLASGIGNPLSLRSDLAAQGFEVLLFPGGPEGGDVNDDLRVRFHAQLLTAGAMTPLGDVLDSVLDGVNPAASISGAFDYGMSSTPTTMTLDLVMGVDAQGFYLLGDSRITLDVHAIGNLTGEIPLPLASLSVQLSGDASADYTLQLSPTVGIIRPGAPPSPAPDPLPAGATGDDWTTDVDGTVDVTLDQQLAYGDAATGAPFSSTFQVAVVDGVVQPVSADIGAPTPDEFLAALFPLFEEGLRSFLSPEVAALVDNVPLPFGDGSGPFPFVGDQTAGTGQPAGALARFFEYVVSRFDTSFDHPGQGIAYTIGDILQRTDQLRAESLATGGGVKVGVISDGYEGLVAAQNNGELPLDVIVNPNLASAGAEGTAMLEIIHDIAPGAELFLSGMGETVDSSRSAPGRFIEAVDWLVSQGVGVIVDDMFFGTEPFYSDGIVARHIQNLIDNPPDHDNDPLTPPLEILFVTAAGNHAERHMRGAFDIAEHTFADGTTRQLHLFDGTDPFLTFASNPSPAAAPHWLALNWNAPYDETVFPWFRLLLVDAAGNVPLPIASADISSSQSILRFTQSKPANATLAIEYVGPDPAPVGLEFSLLASESIPPQGTQVFGSLSDPADSIWGHAALADVLTVGAVNVDNPSQVAPYSARGPATIHGEATPRNVLDVVAGDRVQVSGASGFPVPFAGSSAAAPHVAAMAALLMQLYPDAGRNAIRDAIATSADDIGPPGNDQQSGYGVANAAAADILLDATFDRAALAAPSESGAPLAQPAPPAASPFSFSGGSLLDALGFDLTHAISPQNIQDFLRGAPLSDDLARVSLTLDAGDGFEPVAVSYALDLSDVGGLEQFGLEGAIAAEVTPNLSLSFGIDADGFFLDSTSTAGGFVSGMVHAGASSLGPFGVEIRGRLTAEPSVSFGALGAGRLRTDDLAGALDALQVSLGTVSAELDVALISHLLDYVSVDPVAGNNTPRGGDPFRFVARASLEAASTAGGVSYTFGGIDLLNPDVNEDGRLDFTSAVLVQNLIQLAREELSAPGGLFGGEGRIADELSSLNVPLLDAPLGELLPFDILPDFDTEGLIALSDAALWASEHFELLDVISFDAIETLLNTGSLPPDTEYLRVKAKLDGVSLGFVDRLQAAVGDLLPPSVDLTQLARIENARLVGQIVVGIDSSGPYLLLEDAQGGHDDATRVGLAFDGVVNLSGLVLENEIFALGDAELRVSPEFFLTASSSDPKLRFDDLLAGDLTFALEADLGDIRLTAARAALFPNNPDAAFRGEVTGLRGTVSLDGSFDLAADRVAVDINQAVALSANAVAFEFNGLAAPSTLAMLQDVLVAFPALPNLPRTTIDEVEITFDPGDSSFDLVVDNFVITLDADGPTDAGATGSASAGATGGASATGSASAAAPAGSPAPIARPLLIVPAIGVTKVDPSAPLIMPGQIAGSEFLPEAAFSSQFAANLYADMIDTLTAVGYTLGDTLFVAHYDWRRALAPDDGVADGRITGIDANTLTDDVVAYAVDDLGYWLDRAQSRWQALFGDAPASVDVVAHGHGGLIARAYVQSDAAMAVDASSGGTGTASVVQRLPLVENLIMLGTPNLGSAAELAILSDQWAENDVYNALVAPTTNAAHARLLRDGQIDGPAGPITLVEITDPATGEPSTARFLARYLLLTHSSLPLDPVLDAETTWPQITGVSTSAQGATGSASAAPSPDATGTASATGNSPPAAPFETTLNWQIPDFIEVVDIKLYLSVKRPGKGLFPSDALAGVTPVLNDNGDFDVHPHRIVTTRLPPDARSYTVPSDVPLTAGQTYYFGLEVVEASGVVQRAYFEHLAPIATAVDPNTFSSVTFITHGGELPYVDRKTPEDYLELARSIAKASDGVVARYDPKTGVWNEDAAGARIRDALGRGASLVLVADWATDSAISDSGFSEAAADAMFASLVALNDGLFRFSEDIVDPILRSPLHFIGFGRGASVNAEIVQRLGTFFRSITTDIHVTTLDPHDFDQDSLNLSARNYLDLMKEFSPTFDFLSLLVADETVTDIVQTLTDTSRILYGDLADPEVVSWTNVAFADNFYQTTANSNQQDTGDDIDDLSFTANGRALAGADVNVFLGGGPLAAEHRSGFFADDKRNLVHQRVKAWYAGTLDASLDMFPSTDADASWKQSGDPGALIVRSLYDLGGSTSDFNRPWYPDGEPTDESWEGNGVGWYYSRLGGGAANRPQATGARTSVSQDNSTRLVLTSEESGVAVPTVFNGHFDVSLRPTFGRFPLPAPLIAKIPDSLRPEFLEALAPSQLEVPGWSFHGGSGGIDQGQNLVYLIDALKLFDAHPEIAPGFDRQANDVAAKIVDVLEERFNHIVEDAGARVDDRFATKTLGTRAVAGLKGAFGIIKVPFDIVGAFNLSLADYLTDWFTDVEDLRRQGLVDHAFKIADLGTLKHNRMYFPASAQELTFKYHVAEAAPHNSLIVKWYDEFGNEIFIRENGERIPEPKTIYDEPAFRSRLFATSTNLGFEPFTANIPEDLQGKVGSFEIVPQASTLGFGFTAEVLLDDFRLIDGAGQPASADSPAASSPGAAGSIGGAAFVSSSPSASPGATASLVATANPATTNSVLVDLNTTPGGTGLASAAPSPVPIPYPNLGSKTKVTIVYGTSESTATSTANRVGPAGGTSVFSLTDLEHRTAADGQAWMQVATSANSGDGLVTIKSAVGPFAADNRVSTISLSQGDEAGTVKGLITPRDFGSHHIALPSDIRVQGLVLQKIGVIVLAGSPGGDGGPIISDAKAQIDVSSAVTLLHDGADVTVSDPQAQTVFTGSGDGFGVLVGAAVGSHEFGIAGTGGAYFVQARNIGDRQTGGAADTGTLAAGQPATVGFDVSRIFAGLGIDDVIELGDLSLSINLNLTISPAGVVIHPGTNIGLHADHAALFPDSSTPTDPADVAGTLDGLVTVVGFDGQLDLVTGALHLEAASAGIDVDGVVSVTAVAIEEPPGSGTMLPAIEFDFDPTNTDPAATIGALRGVTVDFEALGDEVPSNLVTINQAILRRNGFSLDGSIGDPAAMISFGGDDPIVRLTGLVGTADIDVTFTPRFAVTGTVGIEAASAEFLPGSEINGTLTGAELTVDLATGATAVTIDELAFEVGDLFSVRAASESGEPAIELDLTSVLTDSSATIVTIPSATISTGLFTDRFGQPISFELEDLVVRGDGASLGSATLPPTDLFLSLGGVDVVEFVGLSASINGLSFDRTSGFGATGLTLSVDEAALLPDRSTSEMDGVATLSGLQINLDLATGDFRVTATSLAASLGDFIEISVEASGNDLVELAITSDPMARMLHLPLVEAAFIGLADVAGIPRDQSPKLQITDLEFYASGNWQIDSIGLVNAAGFAFGVADFLPFALDDVVLSNFGQTPGGGVNFNQFTLDIEAKVNWQSSLFQSLPFDPYVVVGGVRVDEQTDNALPLTIVVDDLRAGKLSFANTGAITIGLENWDVGGIVFEGELTFGQYNGMGALEPITPGGPQLAGYIGFNTAASDVEPFAPGEANFDRFEDTSSPEDAASQHSIDDANSGGNLFDVSVSGGRIAISGAVTNDGSTLSAEFTVDAAIDLRFKLAELFELYGVSFDFTFVVATPLATFAPTFEVTSAMLAVDALRLTFGGDDPDKSLELTALGYTTTGGDYIPAVRINVVPEDNEPLAEFGTLGVHFPDIFTVGGGGTARIGGRISGLRLLQGFIPDVRDDLEIIGDFGDFFSPENEIFSWLPFRVDSLGVRFQDGFFERDQQTMAITGIDDPLAFDLAFSGGFVDVELVDGVRFPLEATFDNLEIDVAKLKRFVTDPGPIPDLANFPIKNLDGISIGLDPFSFFEDSPISFRGKLALGEINQDGIRSIYGRVLGEFAYSDWGGGIDLIISDRGPLLGKINVPMAIVLGQTTLTISGVSGGIAFGVGNLRSVEDPLDLVRDPVFIDPFDVSTEGIKNALRDLLAKEAELGHPVFTWSESFTIGLSGSITSVAVAGAISGNVTLVANVEWPDVQLGPNGEVNQPVTEFIPDLRLFGTGNIAIFGMPIGRAGLLLDYSDPLAPSLAFGFAAPAPGSPLGFLIPAQAELGVLLTTDGLYEAPIVALGSFVNSMAGSTLDQIAVRLEADHTRPLARLLLDLDGDEELSAAEDAQTITSSFILDRLLGGVPDPVNAGQTVPPMLPTSFDAVASFDMGVASRVTNAFTTEFFNVIGDVDGMAAAIRCESLATVPPECVGVPSVASYFAAGQQAVADFAHAIAAAAFEAGLDAWDGFDPRLTISGRIQPTLLGFPIGTPLVDGTIVVDKSGLTVDLSARLTKILQLIVDQSTGGIGGTLLQLLSLGMEDYTQLGFRLKFPEQELITIVRGLLTGGAALLDPNDPTGNTELVPATDLVQAMLNLVNPFAGWEALIASELTIAGFRVGNVSGVMFDKLDADQFDETTGEPLPDPTTLAGSRIYNLDADRDGEPDADRVSISDNDPNLIPVPTYAQYLDIFQKGGLLLTGELLLPAVLRDPVRVISSIDWQPPQNTTVMPPRPYQASDLTSDPVLAFTAFGEYQTWISNIVAALTNIESYGRIQMFVPSLSGLFELGNYLEPYGADEASDGIVEQIIDPNAPNLVVVTPEEEAYLDNNGNATFDIGVDTPLRYAVREPCYDSMIDPAGVDDCTPGDGFVDVNLNDRYDEGVDTLIDLDGVPGPSEEMFVDLDGDGAYFPGGWFVDRGNGLYDDGEPFADAGNGVYDFGEPFVDNNGNGIYDTDSSDTFTDAGSGVYDGPEPFDDANQNGVFDPATETFTDTNGNEQYDAGEAFRDIGNGVFDGAGGSAARVTYVDPANVQTIVQDIIDSFYIEGYLDVKLFSINFGKGFLRIDADGLEAEVDIPWLLGAHATAGIGFRSMSFTETLADLIESPLVASVIDSLPIGVSADEIRQSLLPSSGLPVPDVRVALPVGVLRGELDYDGLRAWIQTVLDVPANVIDVPELPPAEETAFRASFAAFTPGYGDPAAGASATEVYGGMRLEAMLNLPAVVENLDFTFEMILPAIDPVAPPPLANVASLLIPNFTATASATRIDLASGLGGVDLLVRLEGVGGQDAIVSLSKEDIDGTPTLTGTMNGQLTLLGAHSLTVDGAFEADLSLSDPAVFGDIASGTSVLSPTGDYGLNADFHLQFNNDLGGDARQVMRDGQPLSIPAGLRLFADGSLDVLGSSLLGDFALTVDPTPGSAKIEVDASFALDATVGGGDLIELSGSGDMTLDAAGVAAAIDVSLDSGPAAALGFGLSGGTVRLEANTTREERQVGGITLPRHPTDPALPGVPYIRAELDDVAIATNGFSLDGDFSLLLAPTVVEVSGTVDSIDLGPLGRYSGAADMQITSAGIAGAFAVSPAGMPSPVYDLSGTFAMQVNTTGATALGIPANTARLVASDATLGFLDRDVGPAFDPQFELGPFGASATYSATNNRYEMTVSGDVDVWGLGDFRFIGQIASDGLFDIGGSVDIDIVYPENPPTAFEFHGVADIDATRSGLFDPIDFAASISASSPTVFGFPVLPGFTADVTSAGCMTVAVQYESPKSIYEPHILVTRTVSVYVDLNRPIVEQNIFNPANLDPQLCGGGDAEPLDVAFIDAASFNHADGIVFVENDPVAGDLLVRQIDAPEGDEILLTATGLPAGATVDVRVTLVAESLPAINRPSSGEDYQNLRLGVVRLTGVDANRDGVGDLLSVTLAEVIADGEWEFHESLTLDIEIIDGSANGVDFVLLAADRLRYTIVNTTPETAGSVVYYDFDAPITGAYTPTPKFIADTGHLAATPLRHGPDAFVTQRSLLFNAVDEDNDYVEVRMRAPLPEKTLSFEFWMRPDASTTTFEHPIGLGGDNYATVYVRSDTNKIVLKFQSINGVRVERTIGDYVVGQWHHVAVTYDGRDVRGYLNGELTTVTSASGLIDYLAGFEDLVYFGTFDTVTDKAFDGRLDEVRIWNRAITAAEVSLNKDRMLTGAESGLIGYWRFDETSGTTVTDHTPNRQDGVFGPASPENRQPSRSSIVAPLGVPPTNAPGAFEGVPEIQPDTNPPQPISQTAAAETWQRGNNPWKMLLRMDESSGSTLTDFTGTSHNGLLLGGTRTSGAFGRGILLDGVDDFVRIFNTADLPTTGQNFTVTFSLKLDDWLNTNGIVAAYNDNGVAFSIGPSAADDAMLVRTSFGSGSQVAYEASLAGLTNGEFAHFAISFSPTSGVSGVYVNGVLIPDTGDSAWLLGDPTFFSLGRRFLSGSSSQFLRGTIDDFGIFSGSFSPAYAQSVASGGAVALMVDWTAHYYELSVALDDGGPIAPEDVRLTLTGLRFYDHADAGGVTEWLVKSSLDNFRTLVDGGAAHGGKFDRSLASFGPKFTCLRPSDTPLTFRLYGVAPTNETWRVDNLALLGFIHDSSTCIEPPIAIDDGVTTNEDVPVSTGDVTLNDIDPVGGGLTVISFTPPPIGTLVQNGNSFTYTPPANDHTNTSFTYTIRDAVGQEASGTVSITVNPVNDPPSAIGQTVSTNEDTAKAITLSGSDVETSAANLVYAIVTQPSHGTLSGSGRNWTYTPAANYNGPDSFTFRVTDRGDPDGSGAGAATSSPATVTINVTAVNDPPVLVNDTANAWSGYPRVINVLANDSDPDGDDLTVVGVTQPSGQSNVVTFSSSSVTYTPPSNFTGTAVFTYTASDGTTTRTANVTVTVAANVAPTVVVVSPVDLAQNNSMPLFLIASLNASGSFDSDGGPEPLSYQWVQTAGPGNPIFISGANQATASASIGNVTAPRTYQFEVTVSDGISSRVGNVTVRVYAQGDDPGPCNPPSCYPGTTGGASAPVPAAVVAAVPMPLDVDADRTALREDGKPAAALRLAVRARTVDRVLASLAVKAGLGSQRRILPLRAVRSRLPFVEISEAAHDRAMERFSAVD